MLIDRPIEKKKPRHALPRRHHAHTPPSLPLPTLAQTPEWWCEWSEIKAKDNKNNGLPSYVAKYNGKTFAPMSVKEKAVTTGKKDKDVQEMLMSTWGYSNQSRF